MCPPADAPRRVPAVLRRDRALSAQQGWSTAASAVAVSTAHGLPAAVPLAVTATA
jgi:hypothetical protein